MKIVIITGGSRGIGAATALDCARDGMGVILTYNANRRMAEEVVARIGSEGGTAIALPLDVGVSSSFAAFRQRVAETLASTWSRDSFDALVNNAGYGVFKPLESVSEDEFDGLFRVHLKGPFFLAKALLPLMADGGHIVNLGSATSRVATAGVAPYASFKAGLEVLTRYQAKELGHRGIRANSVAPGPIRTELGGGLNEEFETLLSGQTALGRVGEAAEVGAVIAGLLSDRSRWINAQSIEVGGGYMI